jgi:membrane protein YqaA with SNARE-associated domain
LRTSGFALSFGLSPEAGAWKPCDTRRKTWNPPLKPTAHNWAYFGLSAVMLAAASAVFFASLPAHRGVLWLALYTIPSHMFISPLPHEPVLLYFAKSNGAVSCALASTTGSLIAGIWDYWLFVPLMHHPRVRARYANVTLYRRSVGLFRRSPFWTLVLVGATPIPFYPVKFLSIADHYPLKKYLLALFVGRTPRYWLIAYLGHTLLLPNWSLALLALALFVFTAIQSRREGKKKEPAPAAPQPAGSTVDRRASRGA